MKFYKTGKTKDIYTLDDGNFLLKFKDTVTGHAPGISDPGGNKVIGTRDGVASAALKMTHYYFELFKKHGIPTHYVSADLVKNEMVVRPAGLFGKGLEFVVRYKAAGSFVRRFGLYCNDGDELPGVFEATLKDDDREDPPVTKEILIVLKLLTSEQYDTLYSETMKICNLIKEDLAARGLELIDIKVEFGMVDGRIALIDEVSAGNMRVYENGKKLDYLALSDKI